MSKRPVPKSISTASRRRGGHFVRKRGSDNHYYCDNCGNHAFQQRRGFSIYPSVRIFCSKECESEYFPKWQIAIVSIAVFSAWAAYFWPGIEQLFRWLTQQ